MPDREEGFVLPRNPSKPLTLSFSMSDGDYISACDLIREHRDWFEVSRPEAGESRRFIRKEWVRDFIVDSR